MSHLHIPDGILPPVLWLAGLVLTALVLAWSVPASARGGPRLIAYQSALGGIMLAVMALPVPITAFDYCMTLAGPVGVLLGPAAGYQTAFVVCVILALLGQGGITVVGLNALVLGAAVAVARPAYAWFRAGRSAPAALALATGVAQVAAGLLWFALLAAALALSPSAAAAIPSARAGLFGGITLALWLAAVAVESAVALGIGRFLARVRPDLLPAPAAARAAPAALPGGAR
jgi:cobalt/nickel transport system permease protein